MFYSLISLLIFTNPVPIREHRFVLDNECRHSLERGDFKYYDQVADGKLYLSEFSKTKLNCFVWRLINTTDKVVRDLFTGAVQNDLWEAMRKNLKQIAGAKGLGENVEGVLNSLMQNEFSSRRVKKRVAFYCNFKNKEIFNKNSDGDYSEHRLTLFSDVSGALDFNIPFRAWRLKSSILMAGVESYGTLKTKGSTLAVGDVDLGERQSGLWLYGSSTLIKRNSRFKAYLSGGRDTYWGGLPDDMASWYYLSGSMAIRKPWNSRFSLENSSSIVGADYLAPLDPSYLKRFSRRIGVSTLGSYLKKPLGLVLSHTFSDSDRITLFYHEIQKSNSGSLLGQLTFSKGYLRFGGGGGLWKIMFLQAGENTFSSSNGRELHFNFASQWRPRKWLRFEMNTTVAGRYSSDTNMGWYPAWAGTGIVVVTSGRWMGQLNMNYSGYRIRLLAYNQDRKSLGTTLSAKYRYSRRLNFTLSIQNSVLDQTKYQAYEEESTAISPRMDFLLLNNPNLWLTLSGQYRRYRYDQAELRQNSSDLTLSSYLNMRF